MVRRFILALTTVALALGSPSAHAQDAAPVPATWCAPELETLAGDVCHFEAPASGAGRRTLVIFLHGVIQPDTTWQWNQQRGIVVGAKRLGFSVLMPRGRRGIGPPGMNDWITWPTSVTAQKQVEPELLDEWAAARRQVEARSGKPFDEVFVVGFSNGAYYATSLALRGRLAVDGFAVFAGGSAAPHLVKAGAGTRERVPLFVAVSTKDKTTARDSRSLGDALRLLRWPSRVEATPAGHAIADAPLDHALSFLRASASRPPR